VSIEVDFYLGAETKPVCHLQTVVKTGSAPAYVRLPEGKKKLFEEYPELSLEEWHKEHNEYVE
jgi:hypothetical protein